MQEVSLQNVEVKLRITSATFINVAFAYVQSILICICAVNTHMHADHVTGTGMIKRRIPTCKSVISKYTDAKADLYVDDGELIKFGKFSLECRCTQGHTDCESVLHLHLMY